LPRKKVEAGFTAALAKTCRPSHAERNVANLFNHLRQNVPTRFILIARSESFTEQARMKSFLRCPAKNEKIL
jgi:hypothetical protein